MAEYIIKVHFWLACTDTLIIEAANDAEGIEMAKVEAVSVMESKNAPDFIDYDERREGSISYIDRVTDEAREEVVEFLAFDEDRLYSDWHEFLVKVAALSVTIESADAQAEALRQYVTLIEEAKALHAQFA